MSIGNPVTSAVKAVWHSIFTPGIQSWIQPTLNAILSLLFATVFYCIYHGIGGWYMWVMAALAAGLSFSANMVLTEVMAMQAAQGKQAEIDGTAEGEVVVGDGGGKKED